MYLLVAKGETGVARLKPLHVQRPYIQYKREHKSKFCSPLRVTEIFKERYTCITCTSNAFLYYLTVIEYMYLGFFLICVVILNREKYDKPNYFHSMYRHVYAIALY